MITLAVSIAILSPLLTPTASASVIDHAERNGTALSDTADDRIQPTGSVEGTSTSALSRSKKMFMDPSVLRPWNSYDSTLETVEPPFLAQFSNDGRTTLRFIATQHTSDADSRVYALISRAIAAPLDLVLVEGVRTSLGTAPGRVAQHAEAAAGQPHDSEILHAIREAQKAGVPFLGVEPEDCAFFDATEDPAERRDFAGYLLLRQLQQWEREGRIIGGRVGSIPDHLDAYLARFRACRNGDGLADYFSVQNNIDAWYADATGKSLRMDLAPEDTWPSKTPALRTNAIANRISDIRERHIAGVIAESFKDADQVAIVIGYSHYFIQEPALRASFGAPQIETADTVR